MPVLWHQARAKQAWSCQGFQSNETENSSLEWRILQWFQCIGLALSYLKCPKTLRVPLQRKTQVTVSVSVNTVASMSHYHALSLILRKLPVDSNPQSIRQKTPFTLPWLATCHQVNGGKKSEIPFHPYASKMPSWVQLLLAWAKKTIDFAVPVRQLAKTMVKRHLKYTQKQGLMALWSNFSWRIDWPSEFDVFTSLSHCHVSRYRLMHQATV